jgi:glucokinase
MARDLYLGFDLGGTKMLALLMDKDYRVLGRAKNKTPAGATPDTLTEALVETIHEALIQGEVTSQALEAIAIGSPGPLDSRTGRILSTPNLGSRDFPICDLLSKAFGVPAMLDNDVNAGTWGEFKLGAAQGLNHVIGVFPGTGVGGALILNKHLFRGARGFAGEIGHMIIQYEGPRCGCGLRGDVESLCSRSALAKEAVHIAATGRSEILREKAGTDFKRVKSALLAKAYEAGEIEVVRLLDRSAQMLGVGLGNVCTLFDPDAIVLGGGLIQKFGKNYVKMVRDSMLKHTANPTAESIDLLLAGLEDDSVAKGAVALLRDGECHFPDTVR